MKNLFFWILTIGMVPVALAQNSLQFEKSFHDFGEVREEGGPVAYSFHFVNNGSEPMLIDGVNASCGCTTPAWTKEEVAPGDSGYVTASYNPLNRPGHFKKSLQVFYSLGKDKAQETVYIAGHVRPQPKSVEEELSTKLGDLRLKTKILNMGKFTTEKPVKRIFEVYNDSDSVWDWMSERAELPAYMDIAYEQEYLKPHESGTITLTYTPGLENLGFNSETIRLYTTESLMPEKELVVIATVEEYFPEMTKDELEEAPRLIFDKSSHDYGDVRDSTSVSTTFTLTNKGQEKLTIRKVKPNCGCTVSKLEKRKIAPGKSVDMVVTFDSSGRRGRQYKTVTVFSNDPTAPIQTLSLKADVQN